MAAYYNEHDKFAAAWLRELIKAGLIADGEVDERDIRDVQADDVRGFTQCHFFAGIGGWSYALRLASWPDDRSVWTGSCPCQPFSSAGKGYGADDSRDLWPAWFQLIRECRPFVVFGEQVEAAIGHGWFDRLCDDLEREDYAIGSCSLPGPSVGAFDVRARLWFVADAGCGADERLSRSSEASGATRADESEAQQRQRRGLAVGAGGSSGELADTKSSHRRLPVQPGKSRQTCAEPERNSKAGQLAVSECERPENQMHFRGDVLASAARRTSSDVRGTGVPGGMGHTHSRRESTKRGLSGRTAVELARSFWSDAEWIDCKDGKVRPVEPGTFPLAYGVPARVGRLRGYGNAIKPQVAQVFIEAYMDITEVA